MKKIFILRLFILVTALFVGVLANATDVTWTASSQGYTNSEKVTSSTVDSNISLTFTSGSTATAYYTTGSGIRVYSKGGVTVTAGTGVLISKVVFTYSGTGYTGTMSASAGTYSLSSATGTWTGSSSSVIFTNTASGQARIQKIAVTYAASSSDAASAPTFSASATEFTSTLDVTITNNESGSTVYYTTDGTDPTTSSASFTGESTSINLSTTTTVKAMSVISGKTNSLVASATYTYLPTVNTIAAIKALASGTKAVLNLTDAVVTYVNGSDHYVQDATGGLDLYGASYAVGTKLNGSVTGTYTLYNGTPQVASGAKYNMTTTTGASVEAQTVTISTLKGDNKADYACMKIKLENVSYSEDYLIDEDGDSITLYDKAGLLTDYPWADVVNFTGVFCNFYTSAKTTPEVLPISTDNIEVVAGKASPTNIWQITAYKGGKSNVYPTFTTESDGTKNYKSSNASAATIDDTGAVTLVTAGATSTISCYAAVSDTYKATQTVSYELLVDIAGLKDTIDFDNSKFGWTKSGGSNMTTTNYYYTTAPSWGMAGGTSVATLTSHAYYNIQAISFYANASNTGKIALKYSTDSTNWVVLDSIALTKNTTAMQKYVISSDLIGTISSLGNVYLQFYSGFNTPYLDDIVITYTESPDVKAPVFSQTQTAVEEAFNLTLTNPNTMEGDYEIYYTTDGTDPRKSDTQQVYSAAIPVSENSTIKATVYYLTPEAADFFSPVASCSYTFLTGRGTLENPYTVADVIALDNTRTDSCWISGVIVNGMAEAVNKTDANGIVTDTAVVSNIVLTIDGSVSEVNVPVKLTTTPIRTYVNIKDNADNAGQTVKVYGKLDTYFSRPGMLTPVKVIINDYTYTNIWGDVNADMKRDINDVAPLVEILTTGVDNTGGMSDVKGDDKKATISDLTRLIKYLLPYTGQ